MEQLMFNDAMKIVCLVLLSGRGVGIYLVMKYMIIVINT